MLSILEINKLIDLGYDVTFNIGRIDKISEEQLYLICVIKRRMHIHF